VPAFLSRLLLLALLLPGALAAGHGPQPPLPLLGIRVGDVALTVEVADQAREREHGLMHRTELPAGRGMLFVYPGEARRVFWMRDTPLPLDAGFIGADGRLQEIVALEPLSERPVTSQWPTRYVLEVPRGWFADHGLGPGARVEKLP
jgi:uncharacterized membrane protein (UPF0127 family)